MKQLAKLSYDQIEDEQIVDLRPQKEFQSGSLKGTLNLNPKNLIKYGKKLLNNEQSIILVIAAGDSNDIATLVEEAGIENFTGYLVAEEIPETALESMQTISAADFMALEGKYHLLDVRHPDEITRPAPEKNLVNIPIEDLPESYPQLNASQDVYTLCGSGNRGTTAASYLKGKGYRPIVIEGGMGAIEALRQREE